MTSINAASEKPTGVQSSSFDNMNENELLAFIKNEDKFIKEKDANMNSQQSEFSNTTAKPSIFRYFAKDLESSDSAYSSLNVVQLGDRVSHVQGLVSKPPAETHMPDSLLTAKIQGSDEEDATKNVHSFNALKESNEPVSALSHPERVEMPANLSNALEDLTHSVENIISNLPPQVDMHQVWQPLVDGMKKMSEKRERLIEIEKMFDQTVDEMNSLRETMCTTLESIKISEIERAKSLQARLQLATSLQDKLKSI